MLGPARLGTISSARADRLTWAGARNRHRASIATSGLIIDTLVAPE
jgi:hypothetical protein